MTLTPGTRLGNYEIVGRRVVDVRLPGPAQHEVFAIGPDNRTIYYGAARAEADIWIVERK